MVVVPPPKSYIKRAAETRQYGDEVEGFSMELDEPNHLIRMRLWGLWEMATAERFFASVLEFAERLRGSPWGVLIDGRRFIAQSPKITEMREKTMHKIAMLGCTRMANVVTSAAYQMQFSRIAAASHIQAQIFVDEVAAREWVVASFASGTVRTVPRSPTESERPRVPSNHRRGAPR
jgi:hypothetical protein